MCCQVACTLLALLVLFTVSEASVRYTRFYNSSSCVGSVVVQQWNTDTTTCACVESTCTFDKHFNMWAGVQCVKSIPNVCTVVLSIQGWAVRSVWANTADCSNTENVPVSVTAQRPGTCITEVDVWGQFVSYQPNCVQQPDGSKSVALHKFTTSQCRGPFTTIAVAPTKGNELVFCPVFGMGGGAAKARCHCAVRRVVVH